MNLNNINIFIIFSFLVAIISLYFGVYSVILKPFRKSSVSFFIYSFLLFLTSISNSLSYLASSQSEAIIWFYIFTIVSFFIPIALLHLISHFIGFKPKKLKQVYRYICYI